MAADDKAFSKPDPVAGRDRRDRVRIWWYYSVATAALFVAALILPPLLHSGQMFWPLTLIGAIVIGALLSAAAVPHLRHHH